MRFFRMCFVPLALFSCALFSVALFSVALVSGALFPVRFFCHVYDFYHVHECGFSERGIHSARTIFFLMHVEEGRGTPRRIVSCCTGVRSAIEVDVNLRCYLVSMIIILQAYKYFNLIKVIA